ncbi:HupE/UreJ family protein [Acaryochloris marina]|uniref:Hydrogenase accessory protein HupE/UreJ protein, putative n=1 Tax=Acaryochloris marina (strain MBIC 11017) TaxID=329726 RepID=B0C3W9_ACAM1|nr:HupE/UreJ family protein [Acaryochloris marina]ABW26229.1 hydrogenase accessory protein HupE/UreJ protein, putative [Acaryochloris marina MBIC11017]BDM81058.1 hypothetical protein AM10699_39250 [Acaryochloris marina MBIC10699]
MTLSTRSYSPFTSRRLGLGITLGILTLLTCSSPVFAHHPLGGRLPANAFEGFMSGMGHPVIGMDHLAFVIAAGLVAALMRKGVLVPIVFVLGSLAGTGIHLQALDLPAPELFISASVLAFGLVLARGLQTNIWLISLLGAAAGVFHGYAYGEAIVGAEMTPTLSYLLGFVSIQLVISLAAWTIGKAIQKKSQGLLNLRFAGFILSGMGAAFLSSVVLG